MNDRPEIKYRIEKVAPEISLWGNLVMIGMVLPSAIWLGNLSSIGLVLSADFLRSIGTETSAITVIMSTYFISVSCSCLLASTLIKKYAMRFVGLMGAIFYFLGSSMNIFATSIEMLVISNGFFQGCGVGFMLPVLYGTFNQYFIKRRVFMMGVSEVLKGILIMLHPIFVDMLFNEFGHRGAMILIAAKDAHVFLGMLLMHPVEWHFKLIKVPLNALQSSVPLMSMDQLEDKEFNEPKVEIILIDHENRKVTKRGFWYKIIDFFDLTLLKDLIYVNIVLGITFVTFSDFIFFTMLQAYLVECGFSTADAATFAAVAGGAGFTSRVSFAVFSYFISMKTRYGYFAVAFVLILLRFVFLNTLDPIELNVIIFAIGFMHGLSTVQIALTLAEHLSTERFPSGYALFIFLQGIISCLISPIIGWIRDITQSYVTCFYSLSILTSLCVISWVIEFVWIRITTRRTTKYTN